MKHALIVAHPKKTSFTRTMATAYENAARDLGWDTVLRDLYGMDFDPCLHADELAGTSGVQVRPDIVEERRVIGDADIYVFFYPFWFNAPPAILKGYVDRVFGPGFGFQPGAFESTPLLKGRLLVSITSSGAPAAWVESTGAMEALRKLFDQHIALICGMTVVDHVHFGGVASGVREDFVASCANKVRALAASVASSVA